MKKEFTTLGILMVLMLSIALSNRFLTRSSYVQVFNGASTEVCGDISENTTWTLANSPYIVTSDVIVEPEVFLIIEPGVEVQFTNGTALKIYYGGLIAQGNATHIITFTSNSTTPTPGDWGTVRFKGTDFLMEYVLIEYADKGVELIYAGNISDSLIDSCHVGVEGTLHHAYNLTVTNNSDDGLRLSSSLRIENSNVSSNGGHGITITATIDMDNCVVSNNMGNGIILSNGGYIKNSHLIDNHGNGSCIFGPTTIENSEISGNGGDGIWMESAVSIAGCNITENEGNGIKGDYIDGSTTIRNSKVSCNGHDGIGTNSRIEIEECDIVGNSGNGVIAPQNVDMTISSCNICNNTLNGLSGCGYVSYSNMSSNHKWGVIGNYTIENFNNITWNHGGGFNGTGRIRWSSIFNNTLYGSYDAAAGVWPNNITATHNWWGTNESALIREHIWDYNDTAGFGCVFYDQWLPRPPWPIDVIPPEIVNLNWTGTSPGLYDPFSMIRMNEPVRVSVNVTDNESPKPSGVDKVLLFYRVIVNQSIGEWWNTTMTLKKMYNETSGNWTAIIPGQPNSTAIVVEFFIQAYDKAGNIGRSPEMEENYQSYTVKWLWGGDINGDGKIRVNDVLAVAQQFGKGD